MSAMAAPLPQDGLASQLPSDLFDEVLQKADVPTLLKIKGVSRSWRAGARRVLRARLCRREGQPVPTSRAAVTDVDIEPFVKADGPGVAHVAEAMAQFPNLARMHAHGFVVDVAAVRGLGPAPGFNPFNPDDVLQPVRGCIGGEGEPPGVLLLAVCAAGAASSAPPSSPILSSATATRIKFECWTCFAAMGSSQTRISGGCSTPSRWRHLESWRSAIVTRAIDNLTGATSSPTSRSVS